MTEFPDIRVVIADDHPLMRSGVRAALSEASDIQLAGEASDGPEALRLCERLEPDVLVLDLNMPGPTFLETMESLDARAPETSVLVLTAYADSIYVRSVVKAGAAGFVVKDEVPDALINAVRAVARGGTWFSRSAFAKLHLADGDGDAIADLTQREREVLRLVAEGLDNGAIAERLELAEVTVRNYVSRIYGKVGVDSRVKLVVWAREKLL